MILVDDKLFIKYNKDGMHVLKVFKLGNPITYIAEINLPGIGVINVFGLKVKMVQKFQCF